MSRIYVDFPRQPYGDIFSPVSSSSRPLQFAVSLGGEKTLLILLVLRRKYRKLREFSIQLLRNLKFKTLI